MTPEPSRDAVWRAIDDQRRALVALLEPLTESQWRHPSLCEGWTVRDVAAHVALQNTPWSQMPSVIATTLRHRSMDAAIRAVAVAHAAQPVEVLLTELRQRIGVRRPLPTVTYRESAIDYLVHGQDIAVPLGLELTSPPDAAVVAANRLWRSGRMFHARRRLAGFRLVATDGTGWSAGEGLELRGTLDALLLLLTGRPAALDRLEGPGLATLAARGGPPPR